MPLLSVVVPVYRVEAYLRQCLDSILRTAPEEFELIVVDDCSPDGSGDIADEYAARDSRVCVRHLKENVGLGRARNAGLDVATGDFVWFVDSDDWLADGAIEAVTKRLEPTLDMLIVDFARHFERTGASKRSAMARALARSPGPEVFTAVERPSVLGLLHVAWNRVVRRQFLLDEGLRFHPGLYEDVSWTYPAVLAARQIAFLDQVCVYYRLREGAITSTGGARHLGMIHHWELVFAAVPADHSLRPVLFEQSMRQGIAVLGNDARISDRRLRQEFFRRLSAFQRRYAPPGWTPPGGRIHQIKYGLLARRMYPVYSALRWGYKAARRQGPSI
ncbi:MAG: glycosyltransferase [Hamadaea sp.]|uniref:glycosyltransferase family 2 protein n=1 Tax=Hamadaea sp. TaxID=2024425 RepID=UPI0017DA1872|nr:glycosyltransferase [Hamadaea sp.]NUT20317.1 glycosyltransferase [Hamadaea sp.]